MSVKSANLYPQMYSHALLIINLFLLESDLVIKNGLNLRIKLIIISENSKNNLRIYIIMNA